MPPRADGDFNGLHALPVTMRRWGTAMYRNNAYPDLPRECIPREDGRDLGQESWEALWAAWWSRQGDGLTDDGPRMDRLRARMARLAR